MCQRCRDLAAAKERAQETAQEIVKQAGGDMDKAVTMLQEQGYNIIETDWIVEQIWQRWQPESTLVAETCAFLKRGRKGEVGKDGLVVYERALESAIADIVEQAGDQHALEVPHLLAPIYAAAALLVGLYSEDGEMTQTLLDAAVHAHRIACGREGTDESLYNSRPRKTASTLDN